MLYGLFNPFVRHVGARRNPAPADRIRALITMPDEQRLRLSAYPGSSPDLVRRVDDPAVEASTEIARQHLASSPLFSRPEVTNPQTGERARFDLFPYQYAGIAFALSRSGRAIIMDPMGLGKTLQGVGLLASSSADFNFLPAIVICPKSALPSWRNDIGMWTRGIELVEPPSGQLTAAITKARGKNQVLLLSKDQFSGEVQNLSEAAVQTTFAPIRQVIFDESHYLKSPEAQLTRNVAKVAQAVPGLLMLTGTPVLNAAGELYSQMMLLDDPSRLLRPPETQPEEQRNFLERFIQAGDDSAVVKTSTRPFDFQPWSDRISEQLNDFIRKRGARRSRSSVLTRGEQARGAKQREYVLVPPSRDYYARVLDELRLRSDRGRSARTPSQDEQEFADRQNKFQAFTVWLRNEVRSQLTRSLAWRPTPDQMAAYARRLRQALLRGHATVPRWAAKEMGLETVDKAIELHEQKQGDRPSIIFAYNRDVRDALVSALADRDYPIYWTEGSSEVYRGAGKSNPVPGAFAGLSAIFRSVNTWQGTGNERAVIVLTGAGAEGLNLAAADTLIFTQRLVNPGRELQAEDRINRPEQTVAPHIYYLLPADPFSLVYVNRIERKRNSILRSFNESPTDDFSEPLDVNSLAQQAATIISRLPQSEDLREAMDMALAELNPEAKVQTLVDEYIRTTDVTPRETDAQAEARRTREQAQQRAQMDEQRRAMLQEDVERWRREVLGDPLSREELNQVRDLIVEDYKGAVLPERLPTVFGRGLPRFFILHTDAGILQVEPQQGYDLVTHRLGQFRLPREEWNGRTAVGKNGGVIVPQYGSTDTDGEITEGVIEERQGKKLRYNPRKKDDPDEVKIVPVDPAEEQIRRIRLAVYLQERKRGASHAAAFDKTFRVSGRNKQNEKLQFLVPGSNQPSLDSRLRAEEKRTSEDAFAKRQAYEKMLALSRKSSPVRLTREPSYTTGREVIYLWPEGREFRTEAAARSAYAKRTRR